MLIVEGTIFHHPESYVYSSSEGRTYTLDLPGVKKEEINTEIRDGDKLFIEVDSKTRGSVAKYIQLDERDNTDAITAKLENGELTISIPRAESTKPRKIAIS